MPDNNYIYNILLLLDILLLSVNNTVLALNL